MTQTLLLYSFYHLTKNTPIEISIFFFWIVICFEIGGFSASLPLSKNNQPGGILPYLPRRIAYLFQYYLKNGISNGVNLI